MDRTLARWCADSLIWLPERGMGFFPVPEPEAPYDAAYFAKYQGYADTAQGRAITQARIDLVARHYGDGPLLDVGIGSGHFVEHRPNTSGYDVNPAGVRWLEDRGLFVDLWDVTIDAASFWDSLEHIPEPGFSLEHVRRWVFLSVPIFEDVAHVLRSKHYRKDEHLYYWTDAGLVAWMDQQGFVLRERNTMEVDLGRDGIGSYAFERVAR